MNPFDAGILAFLNQFAQKAWAVDSIVVYLSDTNLVKGAAIGMIFWFLWFYLGEDAQEKRSVLLATLIAAFIALVVTRGLSAIAPFRPRPIHNPEILFNIPKTLDPRALVTFNSFPSDHATLFYALATGFFIANRKMGVLTFIYVTLLIAIPRLYVGLHYPTDVLAGAILGIGITAFFITRPRVRELIKQWVLVWLDRQPGLFYAAIFIITFQIGTLFIESRELASYIFEFISRTISFFQRNYGWFV